MDRDGFLSKFWASRIIWVRYIMAICKDVSISFHILVEEGGMFGGCSAYDSLNGRRDDDRREYCSSWLG